MTYQSQIYFNGKYFDVQWIETKDRVEDSVTIVSIHPLEYISVPDQPSFKQALNLKAEKIREAQKIQNGSRK
jgi:hypothetical protein